MPKSKFSSKKKKGGRYVKQQTGMSSSGVPYCPQKIYVKNEKMYAIPYVLSSSSGSITDVKTLSIATSLFNTANGPLTCFDMFYIHEWGAEVYPISNNAGTSYVFFDPDDATAITLALSDRKYNRVISNSNTSANAGKVVIKWRPKGPTYCQWIDTGVGSGTLPYTASFKVFTDTANMGTTNASNAIFTIRLYAKMSFAGLI